MKDLLLYDSEKIESRIEDNSLINEGYILEELYKTITLAEEYMNYIREEDEASADGGSDGNNSGEDNKSDNSNTGNSQDTAKKASFISKVIGYIKSTISKIGSKIKEMPSSSNTIDFGDIEIVPNPDPKDAAAQRRMEAVKRVMGKDFVLDDKCVIPPLEKFTAESIDPRFFKTINIGEMTKKHLDSIKDKYKEISVNISNTLAAKKYEEDKAKINSKYTEIIEQCGSFNAKIAKDFEGINNVGKFEYVASDIEKAVEQLPDTQEIKETFTELNQLLEGWVKIIDTNLNSNEFKRSNNKDFMAALTDISNKCSKLTQNVLGSFSAIEDKVAMIKRAAETLSTTAEDLAIREAAKNGKIVSKNSADQQNRDSYNKGNYDKLYADWQKYKNDYANARDNKTRDALAKKLDDIRGQLIYINSEEGRKLPTLSAKSDNSKQNQNGKK